MGLIDNTKNIELAITEKNKQDKQNQIEKRKKQEEAENLKRLKSDIIRELKQYFDNAMEQENDLQKYYLKSYFIDFKNNIIENYGNNKTKTKNFIIDIINDNYYKILKNKIAIQKKQLEIMEEYKQEEEKKEEKEESNFFNFCKIIIYTSCFIVFFPLVFIFLIILSLTKNAK